MQKTGDRHSLFRKHKQHFILITLAAFVFLCGITLWILGGKDILPESWWTAMGTTFTVIGALSPTVFMAWSPSHSQKNQTDSLNKRKGNLIVRTSKVLCGSTVNLCFGFDSAALCADLATNIVEHRIDATTVEYIGEIRQLEPGNYIVYVDGNGPKAKVTVVGGHTAEIDWRYRRSGGVPASLPPKSDVSV